MKTITIGMVWLSVQKDIAAKTWKQGYLNPREDGRQGETQVSELEPMDMHIVKQDFCDALAGLVEVVKRWVSDAGTLPVSPSGVTESSSWIIDLEVSDRCEATGEQVSALGQKYVVSHVVAEWYKKTAPELVDSWVTSREEARARLLAALHHKGAPVLE